MADLEQRIALVTGGLRGLGRAMSLGLAKAGHRVVAVGHIESDVAEMTAEAEKLAAGKRFHPLVADLREASECDRVVAAARDRFGRIDILVNNAGLTFTYIDPARFRRNSLQRFWMIGDDIVDNVITTNYLAADRLSRRVAPEMIERRWGRIVNITGKSEPEGLNAAFSAKAAVHAWAKGLSREIGRYGITINSIPPGRIMSEQIRRNYPEEYRKEHAAKEIPAGRYGEPEDLAVLAVFLASPLAHYITGTVIPVDGGLRRYSF
jgi:3-oxoacyl-[acyl-carrier protein] reductase